MESRETGGSRAAHRACKKDGSIPRLGMATATDSLGSVDSEREFAAKIKVFRGSTAVSFLGLSYD